MGKRPRTGENRICAVCAKEYYVSGWRLKRGPSRFCSTDCQNHKQYQRSQFNCKECNKQFFSSPCRKKKKVFCSLECRWSFEAKRHQDQKQKRKESMAKVRKKGLLPNNGPFQRKFALNNKENKCQVCGYKEFKCCLDIHHKDNNPSNNCLENLIVLCVMCHRKVHRKIIKL